MRISRAGRPVVAASLSARSREMATAEDQTVANIHIRQAERHVPARGGVRGKFGKIFGQSNGKRSAGRVSRFGCKIYDRRDRQLRVRRQHARPRRREQRVSKNGQKNQYVQHETESSRGYYAVHAVGVSGGRPLFANEGHRRVFHKSGTRHD